MAKEDRLKQALNDADILGLTGADEDALGTLFTEYFAEDVPSSSDEEGSLSDADEDTDSDASSMDIEDSVQDREEDMDDDTEPIAADLAEDIVGAIGTDDWVSPDTEEEIDKIQRFSKCRCRRRRCIEKFEVDAVLKLRMQMSDASLSKAEKKMFLLGKISTHFNNSTTTSCKKRPTQKRRSRTRTKHIIDGVKVCRETFLFMHNISNNLLMSLTKHYKDEGPTPPRLRSGGRVFNTQALSVHDIQRVVRFITSYAEDHALVIPGRISGVKCQDPRVRLLPSAENKSSIWRKYKTHISDLNATRELSGQHAFRITKRSTFAKLWNRYCPFILTTRPKTDLCWICQKNNRLVYQSANQLEEEKMERLQAQQEHLRIVNMERELYRKMVADCKAVIGEERLGVHQPASRQGKVHYSFDFAQQVHFPSDPLQPGPMYFLCPRKCGIFGVCCEGVPQQVNYLIDEGMTISKGSNAVLSYLHHFFDNFGMGEMDVELHCDNCSGQNKNNFVMWYFMWRTLHGFHKKVSVNFLIAGHTKFSPDWCFGLLKQRYRRCLVSSLDDLSEAVRSSTACGLNVPQLVGHEDGRCLVPLRDWQAFLKPFFTTLPGIKGYQHIRFSQDDPGVAFVKKYADSTEVRIQLLRDQNVLPPKNLPEPVHPPGLSVQRSKYLHQHIRQYCTTQTRDVVCPAPPEAETSDADEEGSRSDTDK